MINQLDDLFQGRNDNLFQGGNDDDKPACAYSAYCRYSHLNQPRHAGFYVLNKIIIKT